MSFVLYHMAMAVVAGIVLLRVRKRPCPAACAAAMLWVWAASLLAAFLLGGFAFLGIRLFAWGVFLYGGLVPAGCALLCWKRARRTAWACIALAALAAVVAVDAFLIEPERLQVTRLAFTSSKITRPYKIILITDLQTDRWGGYERMVLWRVKEEGADLILFGGDYFQVHGMARWRTLTERMRADLVEAALDPRLGMYAVRGNTDPRRWTELFDGLAVTCMEETGAIRVGELCLTCLSLRDSFNTNLIVPSHDVYQVVLGHAPDYALGDVSADLLLAGHTHGGQVRLPFIGPLMTLSSVPRSWASGVTKLDGGAALIVSRGIGMERLEAPRMRFLCPPELVVVELLPE